MEFTNREWDQYAQCYDALCLLKPYTAMLDDVLNSIADLRGPILDAGCGTGNLVVRLLNNKSNTRNPPDITALDSSVAMLDRAKQKCSRSNVRFIGASLDHDLPFGDGLFGSVFCVNALYAVVNPEQTLGEFSRILRPGGTLVIATPRFGYENGLILKEHCGSKNPDEYWLDAHQSPGREELLLREALQEDDLVRRFLQIAHFNRYIAGERKFHFFTEDELSSAAVHAGFCPIRSGMTYAGQNLLLVAIKPN